MTITDIKIQKTNWQDPKVLAIASIIIDNSFIINNIRIIQGAERVFLAMPSIKTSWGFQDAVHPISAKVRNDLEEQVIAAYLQL